jgi:adenylate cyclase
MPFRRCFPPHPEVDRLDQLIAARLAPHADKAAVDATLWKEFGTTCAVMFTDLSGFSRQVATFGIVHFLQIIREAARLHVPIIDQHKGTLLKVEGDSMLVTFNTAPEAFACAKAMQAVSAAYNQTAIPEETVLLCVGLGYGPVLKISTADVFGAEVNAASKLGEDIAKANEILVTDNFRAALETSAQANFTRIEQIPSGASGAWKWMGLGTNQK